MKWYLLAVAALHLAFMLCELFPWSYPVLLRIASKKLPEVRGGSAWTERQQQLVATIVHNSVIYNAILAGGLFWAALPAEPVRDVARVLLLGAAAAGIFGTVTLKSPFTALQALLGLIGFVLL